MVGPLRAKVSLTPSLQSQESTDALKKCLKDLSCDGKAPSLEPNCTGANSARQALVLQYDRFCCQPTKLWNFQSLHVRTFCEPGTGSVSALFSFDVT